MEICFTTHVFKEGELYVAYTPELDISSCGVSIEEAKAHLNEALTAFLEEAERMNTLHSILEEAGFQPTTAHETWEGPEPLLFERSHLVVPTV